MNSNFFNRQVELSALNKRYDSSKFELICVYGRRRIGKTQLIIESLKNRKCITCTGLKTTYEENLKNLSFAFLSVLMPNMPIPKFDSFRELFQFINSLETFLKGNYVIALDEFPLLCGADDELSSVLQYSIDHYWINSNLKVVICGSSISFMKEKVLSGDSPLYGRITLNLEVKPFKLWEIKAYNWPYSIEENTILYSVLGGIPRYLNLVNSSISFIDNLNQIFFSQDALLAGEVDDLLKEEFTEVSRYSVVLSAIANGKSSLNEISQELNMQTGTASFYLTNLIKVGIIIKEVPLGTTNNKKAIYTIHDGLFRFFFKFVRPNTNMINFGQGKHVLDNLVLPYLSVYMGLEWEHISIDYLLASYNAKRDPFLYSNLSRWWGGSNKTKTQIEIDCMATFKDNILFGECKWTNDLVDEKILNELQKKAQNFDYKDKYYYLFSKSGFNQNIIKKSKQDSNLKLITLEEVYNF